MHKPIRPPNWNEIVSKEDFTNWINNKDVVAIVRKCQLEYYYWEDLRYRYPSPPLSLDKIWALIKVFRTQQYNEIILGGTEFNYYVTEIAQEKLHFIDSHAGQVIGSESPLGKFESRERERYLINSLMEEAIASSQMEGAMTTRKVAKEMLRTKRKPKTNSERMIYNNFQTMTYIKELFDDKTGKNRQLTPDIILTIHKKITSGTLKNKDAEGKFRQTDDITVDDPSTNEVIHVPPAANRITEYMNDICHFANVHSQPFIHPLVKAVMLHFLIGYVHPFEDGNGRTARALFYWQCLRSGYWTFEYMPISRIIKRAYAQYGRAYLHTEYDDMDLNYFIHYNLGCIEKANEELNQYLIRKQTERTHALQMMNQMSKLMNLRQSLIIKEFTDNPERIITIRETQTKFNVTYQTARTDLIYLTKNGFLEQKKHGKQFVYQKSTHFEEKIEKLTDKEKK